MPGTLTAVPGTYGGTAVPGTLSHGGTWNPLRLWYLAPQPRFCTWHRKGVLVPGTRVGVRHERVDFGATGLRGLAGGQRASPWDRAVCKLEIGPIRSIPRHGPVCNVRVGLDGADVEMMSSCCVCRMMPSPRKMARLTAMSTQRCQRCLEPFDAEVPGTLTPLLYLAPKGGFGARRVSG